MDKKEELTQLVEMVQKDMEKFELLYSHIINKVYYWCYSVVNNEALAKDLAQESMIRIHRNLHKLKKAETFNSWMYILVRNVCYNHMRLNKNKNVQFLDFDEYSEEFENIIEDERVGNTPQESYNTKEMRQLIVGFVDELPRKQKEVIMLFYLEEFSTVEIAKMLNTKAGTVRSCLRAGRVNLEKKMIDYQEKNNIKLYSVTLLPLLGEILREHRAEIGQNCGLAYEKNLFKVGKVSKFTKLTQATSTMSTTTITIISVTLAISLIATVTLISQMVGNSEGEGKGGTHFSHLLETDEQEIIEKLENHPYIESITYSTFPTRNSTSVIINLEKDVDEESIKILFEDENVSFIKDNHEIIVIVIQNGEYSIAIKNHIFEFDITTIDEYAPEIVEIQNHKSHLQLIVNDEKSQINYEKSYVVFNGERFSISRDNKVIGNFSGDIVIYIYNDLNQYGYYEIHLE